MREAEREPPPGSEATLPDKLLAAGGLPRRPWLEPTTAQSFARTLAALGYRPGSALLLGVGAALILVGWPVLAGLLLRGSELAWVVGGWGASVQFALALPALLALALQLVRRRPLARAELVRALRHAPASVASLAVAFSLAAPAVGLGLVPCLGGLAVCVAWLALLLGAAGATCFALERGLDPLGAMDAFRQAEVRWGRGYRWALACVLLVVGLLGTILLAMVTAGAGELGALVSLPPLLLLVSALFLVSAAAHAVTLAGELRPLGPAEPGREAPRLFGPVASESGPLPWLAMLALLVPLGTPFWGVALAPLIGSSTLPLATWAAIPAVHLVSLAGGLLLLHLHRARVRVVAVDWTGVRLDWQGGGTGRYVPWGRVTGFALEADGVRLVIDGDRLPRWLGPVIPARDREVHDLVELLEKRGVERLA